MTDKDDKELMDWLDAKEDNPLTLEDKWRIEEEIKNQEEK